MCGGDDATCLKLRRTALREAGLVNSIPPAYFGGNIDNGRIDKGAAMYYPVAVEGALFSVGRPAREPRRSRALQRRL